MKANPNFMLFGTQNPPGAYGGRKVGCDIPFHVYLYSFFYIWDLNVIKCTCLCNKAIYYVIAFANIIGHKFKTRVDGGFFVLFSSFFCFPLDIIFCFRFYHVPFVTVSLSFILKTFPVMSWWRYFIGAVSCLCLTPTRWSGS